MLALAALCRPAFLLWTLAAGAVLWWQNYRRHSIANNNSRGPTARGRIANHRCFPWAFALGALFVLSPWAIRNQIQFGRPIVTTTHGGYTLLLANNPEFYDWLRVGAWGSVWQADQFNADWKHRRPADELQADRQAYAEAWHTIRREPGTFLYACLVRIGRFWTPLPHQLAARRDAAPPPVALRGGAVVRSGVRVGAAGIWRLAFQRGGERREGREEGKQQYFCGSSMPSPSPKGRGTDILLLPPSRPPPPSVPFRFRLALGLIAGRLFAGQPRRVLDRHADAGPVMPVVAIIAANGLFRQSTRIAAEKIA